MPRTLRNQQVLHCFVRPCSWPLRGTTTSRRETSKKRPTASLISSTGTNPLNGPTDKEGTALVAPVTGPPATKQAFLDAAGPAFPRMANFSFEIGNAHWTILDANTSVDWTDAKLQKWVADDLAAAKNSGWRFVNFHQPGFNSSKSHFDEQYMRILAPVFEKGKVDVVFNGHVHNYQRSYPMHFLPEAAAPLEPDGKAKKTRRLGGKWTLDMTFDGKRDTSPEGVIYIVTGAGGQQLYNAEQQDQPETWQEFTFKHISKVHTLSVVDIAGSTMTLRQIMPNGEEADRFAIKK